MGDRWEFPGGKVDPGETPETAIIREFSEEMGLDVIPGEFLTSVEFSNRNGPVQLLAYRVVFPKDRTPVLTEHTELKWSTLKEIEELAFVDSDRLLIPFLKKWCTHET